MRRLMAYAGLAFWAWLIPAGIASADAPVDFQRQVKPLLARRCVACHGPQKQKSELRLDRSADAFKGGESGKPVIKPGKSAQSEIIRRITSPDEEERMPPKGKPLSEQEIAFIRQWIDQGAVWPEPSGAGKHWAYVPVTRPDAPAVKDAAWVRNPIDAFILAGLESKGWKPNPSATQRQLMRRVYLDLTGLPPTLAQQDAFLADQSPDALAKLVDQLLADPGYGERWGRHWLDMARYAESNGYERDGAKPQAWRYRDYVIQSFNEDTPFDRFIIEQMAGDELPDANARTLIATGFHRLGPWDDEPSDPVQDRADQIDDMIRATSQVFLATTMGCARCHDHKFDPLKTREYYSLYAVFDPLRRPQDGRTDLDRPAGTRAEVAALAARDARLGELAREIEKLKAGKTPDSAGQIVLKEKEIADLRAKTRDLPLGYFWTEPSPNAPKSHILLRGQASRPGDEVQPAVPAALVASQPAFLPPDQYTTRRRLSLANWIASSDNPMTARVIVNRIWHYHFGDGLVRTPSDFGLVGAPPSHPELLDYLADWFTHEGGWSIKKLHRLIMSSNTYRLSKEWNEQAGSADPEDMAFWRFPYKRLEVEAIRDSMLSVSGRLNRKMGGPSMYPAIQKEALEGSSDPGTVWKPSDEAEASRRTIYVFVKRSLVVPMLEVLDVCDTAQSADRRAVTHIAPQALQLFNGEFVNRQAELLAERLIREAGTEPARQIGLMYRLLLCRPATEVETRGMVEFLGRQAERFRKESTAAGKVMSDTELARRALAQMCRVALNLNEFVYSD